MTRRRDDHTLAIKMDVFLDAWELDFCDLSETVIIHL